MPNAPLLLALDQGTTSSRALVFGLAGGVLAQAQAPLPQSYPAPGWVEHDAEAIWNDQLACARQALNGRAPGDVAAIGVANQRETVVLWERASGRPLAPAIVWQDRRTASCCEALRAGGVEAEVRQRSGLPLDPYFSASKIAWWLARHPDWRRRAEAGELAVGNIDSWLLWRLTEGRVHATDVTNASRTQLMNLHSGQWDPELLRLFDIPAALLPEIRPSAAAFGYTTLLGGRIAIGALVGDQQAALFGQGCTQAGQVKNTYGTGCFMLMHTGGEVAVSQHGLLSTRAAQWDDTPQFALEGSVFVGGAVVQWLRDGLGLIQTSGDVEALAASVPDSGGVRLVPAFTGLGAPYWDAEARGAILGLTRGSTAAHIARAALDAIALQSAELLAAMQADAPALRLDALRVDGGACANGLLMQTQADVLGLAVKRPALLEATAWGAARLAAVQAGLQVQAAAPPCTRFMPQRDAAWRARQQAEWRAAVARVRA